MALSLAERGSKVAEAEAHEPTFVTRNGMM